MATMQMSSLQLYSAQDGLTNSPGTYVTGLDNNRVMEVQQEELPDRTLLTRRENLRLEGMEARMRDLTRQMKRLQSAMDSVKGQAHPQQYPSLRRIHFGASHLWIIGYVGNQLLEDINLLELCSHQSR